MVFRMIKPWKNPRSEFWWFRRRVPKEYLRFGMPAEIKFSLGTKDLREAEMICQEENLRLEREWRAGLIGKPPDELSHLQITALAGEFYAETVAAHRDEPGPTAVWEDHLRAIADVKSRRIISSQQWLNIAYGEEARSFLKRKGLHLVGQRFDKYLRAFVDAKTLAAGTLLENAKGNYSLEAHRSSIDQIDCSSKLIYFGLRGRLVRDHGMPSMSRISIRRTLRTDNVGDSNRSGTTSGAYRDRLVAQEKCGPDDPYVWHAASN